MIKISILLCIAVYLAALSQKNKEKCEKYHVRYDRFQDKAYILLLIVLILFSGLRIRYNDTVTYINGFRTGSTFSEYIRSLGDVNLLKNPGFYFCRSILRSITSEPQWMILISSAFVQISFIRFFKRYSEHFTYCVFLYIALEIFCFNMAAIKQSIAIAIILNAFPCLEKKKYVKFYICVLIATLFHAYALIYVILPFLRNKTWSIVSYGIVAALILVMGNFSEIISSFLDMADDYGKNIAEYEVINEYSISIFRVLVFAVVPVLSFIFQSSVNKSRDDNLNMFVNMSLVSLSFMVMGLNGGANMFARMSTYFQMGTVCALPGILQVSLGESTRRTVTAISVACFLFYFVYAYGISSSFDSSFKALILF